MELENIHAILIIHHASFMFYWKITRLNHLGLDLIQLFHLIIECSFVRLE